MTAITVLAIFDDLVVPLSEYSTKDGAGAPDRPAPYESGATEVIKCTYKVNYKPLNLQGCRLICNQ